MHISTIKHFVQITEIVGSNVLCVIVATIMYTHMYVHVWDTFGVHFSPIDATLLSLFQYLCGVKQLVQFISALQSLSVTETTPHFTADKLHQVKC